MVRESDFVDECYADKDLSLLKKLTLVIPTYNRNFYLSRCLWYHAHFPFGQIIVADSSPEEKKVVNRETVGKIREIFGANVLYLEYEPETEKYGGDIYRKWGDAVQHVETEYSQICTDKEFLVPTTICMSVAFLDNHSNYSIAEGMDCLIDSFHGDDFTFSLWQGSSSFEQEQIAERIYACIQNPDIVGTLFSVQRSENQKREYMNLVKYHIDDIRFGEISLETQPFVFGKTKKLTEHIANCRDVRRVHKYNPLRTTEKKDESSFIRYPAFDEYSKDLISELSVKVSKCFQDIEQSLAQNSKRSIGTPYSEYIVKLMEKRYVPRHSLLKKSKILNTIWTNFPIKVQQHLSVRFGYGVMKRPQVIYLTNDLLCIKEVITIYDDFYGGDKAVPLTNEHKDDGYE